MTAYPSPIGNARLCASCLTLTDSQDQCPSCCSYQLVELPQGTVAFILGNPKRNTYRLRSCSAGAIMEEP